MLSTRLPPCSSIKLHLIQRSRIRFVPVNTGDPHAAWIEQRILDRSLNDEERRRTSESPSVGVLTATVGISVMGQAKTFQSGRECAA